MNFIYYRTVLVDKLDLSLEDGIRQRAAEIINRMVTDNSSYGIRKSKVTCVFFGKENGLYFYKVAIKVRSNIMLRLSMEGTSYHKEDLIESLNSILGDRGKGILLYVLDQDLLEEYDYVIRKVGNEHGIKRKTNISYQQESV